MRAYELCALSTASKMKRREDAWAEPPPTLNRQPYEHKASRLEPHPDSTTPRLHDSSSRSLWLSLSLRYLPIRELSAELKAPRGEPVTQYTAHCCAHISNCQDATFSPVKRQTPELGKHQTHSKLVTESIWAEAGGMRKPHSQGHVQVQVSYLRGSNTRHRCCLW